MKIRNHFLLKLAGFRPVSKYSEEPLGKWLSELIDRFFLCLIAAVVMAGIIICAAVYSVEKIDREEEAEETAGTTYSEPAPTKVKDTLSVKAGEGLSLYLFTDSDMKNIVDGLRRANAGLDRAIADLKAYNERNGVKMAVDSGLCETVTSLNCNIPEAPGSR